VVIWSPASHVCAEVAAIAERARRHLCINTSSLGVNRDGAFAEYVVNRKATYGATRTIWTLIWARSSIR